MYTPADVRHETKTVAIVNQRTWTYQEHGESKLDQEITYLGPIAVETWRGTDAPRHQFSYVVRDQPSVFLECRDGAEDTRNYVKHTIRRDKKVFGIKLGLSTSTKTYKAYELKSGCQRFAQLSAAERARRTPTVATRLDECCSQCPYAEIVSCQ